MTGDNWGLLGHERVVEILRHHIEQDSVRQAYLFSGPPGIGKRSLALHFAQALNCPEMITPGTPCRTCHTCLQIEKMQYPDLAVVQSDPINENSIVDQIRSLQYSLSLNPYQGKFRIALFLRFNEFHESASNALLKTLEEAPKHVILILTADNPEQLLPTIVSRCEVYRLPIVPIKIVQEYFLDQSNDLEYSHLLAHISDSRPGFALRIQKYAEYLSIRNKKLDELTDLLTSNRIKRFSYAEKLSRDSKDKRSKMIEKLKKKDEKEDYFLKDWLPYWSSEMQLVLEIWCSFWRDVMLTCSGANFIITNSDREEEIRKVAASISLPQARQVVITIEKTIERLNRNVNARMLLEVLLLDWPYIRQI
jgi:DNA polymerase-3 subunit delta'